MAKRLTDTLIWDEPWFVRLPPLSKLLWFYINNRCDRSGVIDLCPEVTSVQIGGKITEDSMQDFGARVKRLASGKWRIMDFLPFQYKTVDAHCPTHKDIILKILENGINYPVANLDPSLDGRVYHRLGHTLQEEEEETDTDMEEEEETEMETDTDKETDKDIDW